MTDFHEYYVVLKSVGPDRVAVVSALRKILEQVGVAECGELVARAQRGPIRVKEGIGRDDAEIVQQILEAAGATAEIVQIQIPGLDYI
ncbi:MAG TPA: ribosomal protein L7/L12 [Methylomirabilota bacterium]|jgi:ribosomal protein L7/L12|nr:ribosomal protein L7/L12 [Methylomirabilota bacterium]